MLVGRGAERDQIREALDQHRLVTLLGPGGVGKTTLATATTEEYAAESVFFASLGPVGATDLAGAAAADLGFASLDEFLDAAADEEWLVVLDNCEHVVDAAAALAARMLGATTKLRILATSRERLELADEVAIVVEPLSLQGTPSPAVELFLAAAQRRGTTIEWPSPDVDELCARLDGLPLAIELAAARTSSMTAAEIVESLDDSIELLARRRGQGPERHQSLAAAIDWSHRQLDEDEQALFRSLAVLDGSFTAPMAAAAADLGLPETSDLLAALIDRSLVVHEPTTGVSWYRMLATVRAYADDRLGERDGRAEAEERLTRYLVARADGLAGVGLFTDAAAPLELKQAYRVFHRAIERSLETGDEDRCNRLAAPMWWLSELGHQAESAELLRRVVERFDSDEQATAQTRAILGDLLLVSQSRDAAAEVAKRAATAGGLAEALAERVLGLVAAGQGRWDDAIDHYRIAERRASEGGMAGLALEIRNNAALATARLGDVGSAVDQLDVLLVESAGEELVNAWIGEFLSYVLLSVDPTRSTQLSLTTLEVGQRSTNGWIVGSARTNLAMAATLGDDLAEAATQTLAGIAAFQSINNRVDITLSFLAAAAIFTRWGDDAAATAAVSTERSYIDSAVGAFEASLFERLGPIPPHDPSVPPMPVVEMIERLEAIAADAAAADADPAAEAGTDASGADPVISPPQQDQGQHRFVLAGDVWEITYDGSTILQRTSKGLADIARLLEHPDREIAAVDLAGTVVVGSGTGEVIDDEARRHYQDRIRDLQAEIEDAETNNDRHRADAATDELDHLVNQLTEAYGLGGRARTTGDPAEKARSSVTARIRAALRRIGESDARLADHLLRSIKTGRFCVYSPGDGTRWVVNRGPDRP